MSAGLPSKKDRTLEEFSKVLKEYAAFDRTLDALSALTYALNNIREIKAETDLIDFTPRLEPVDLDAVRYTPDGLVIQKYCDFVLELKTSWNESDVKQIIKYARSGAYFLKDDSRKPFKTDKCALLGYQNPPGEANLAKLFDAWQALKTPFSLVIFRYSLEQGAEGERMYFVRVPYTRNCLCPTTSRFGEAINSPRGFPVKAANYKLHRPRFHKANDQVIASYAAVLWWTRYAEHYLSEEQKSEMAERGRLTSPLTILWNKIDEVPKMAGTDVQLGPSDVRHALEFLQEAKLVKLKKKAKEFDIILKEDRFIRLPQGIPVPDAGLDISVKILGRWASNRVKKPVRKAKLPKRARPRRRSKGGRRDNRTLPMFPA